MFGAIICAWRYFLQPVVTERIGLRSMTGAGCRYIHRDRKRGGYVFAGVPGRGIPSPRICRFGPISLARFVVLGVMIWTAAVLRRAI